jgi:hypothetical protein
MNILRDPDAAAALQFLQTEIAGLMERRGHLVQAVGLCTVRYQGRARSDLSAGERLVLLKPDGTLLVHGAAKAKPINWQPPGASFTAALADGQVCLTAVRTRPEEIVQVAFTRIDLLASLPLRDEADLDLLGTEDDLQAALFAHPELVEAGFVPARRERETKRGFLDLDGRDAKGRRVVVEVKRTQAGVGEAQQLWRYVERMRGQDPTLRGILVAPRVAEKARALLADHQLEWREVEWSEVLPKVEAMRESGQASLARFG